ncbi:hypothetical protein OIDMADRAFT_50949 [Oidiodendron maius Zn]|uniref:Cyanate hydratase n=1 Tax=Oidiodendron maius (strain Zn) TaxID=913774 RepID=A0A0C3HQ51_OIDMZ|nr:hypothetical protein OIDMADRAFT_50949 [Oidiodendron maius Zn]
MAQQVNQDIAVLDSSLISRLPISSKTLFDAKTSRGLTFSAIASELNRSEVFVAALFYGQARADPDDIPKLSSVLDVPESTLREQLLGFPDRGRAGPMPPVEPLIYRLYEIVQNYGYAYKAVMNEKFGDGIMSAICFSSKVEKEVDEKGDTYAVITMRGKWLPFTKF